MRTRVLIPIGGVFLLLTVGVLAHAQLQTGEIAGTVLDPNGDPLPGVTVTLEGETVGLVPRLAVTSLGGRFRFAQLSPGSYLLTYELDGFQTLTQTGIDVEVGTAQEMFAELALGGVEETVVVTAERPVMEKRKTGLATELGEDYLESVPTSRDPWMVISLVPGIQVDRVNVGGSESGMQSRFIGHGSGKDYTAGGSAQWTWDGIVITDMAATGTSPMYYDFDSFAEMNVQTAGHDVQTPFGNVGLNFVTKQGSDTWRGQASFFGTEDAFQSTNTPKTEEFDGVATNRVNEIRDWGFDLGGPLVKGRAWLWGAFRTQDIGITALSRTFEQPVQDATLENWNLKLHGNVTPDNRVTFSWARSNNLKRGLGASATRPPDTTWNLDAVTDIYKIEDQHVFGDALLLSGSYGYVDFGFESIPRGGFDVPLILDLGTGIYENSTYFGYRTVRPQHQLRADGNAFVAETLGADHELKFGFIYRNTDTNSATVYGNGNQLLTLNGLPYGVFLFRDAADLDAPTDDYSANYTGFYVGDTITRGRLTLNVGGRIDVQSSLADAVSMPANPLIPQALQEAIFSGADTDTDWLDLSPRIGITVDLFDDGKTLLKGNFAGYAAQRMQMVPDAYLNYASTAFAAFFCFDPACGIDGLGPTSTSQLFDLNRDGRITARLFPRGDLVAFGGFDPEDPTPRTIATYDPDLTAPRSLELVTGIQQEITRGLALGANLIWRRNDSPIWFSTQRPGGEAFGTDPGAILTPADFVQRTVDGVTFFDLDGTAVGAGRHIANRPAYHDTYVALELRAQKRLADHWMADVSFTWSDWTQTWDCFDPAAPTRVSGEVCYQDPTNIALLNDRWIYHSRTDAADPEVWVGARWSFKATGTYRFPYGIDVSGVVLGREGYAFPPSVWVAPGLRSGGIGGVRKITEPFGESRLPDLWAADLGIQKETRFGRDHSVTLVLDAFNLFNASTLLGQEAQAGALTFAGMTPNPFFESPLQIVAPRIFRLGFVLSVGK